MRIFWVVMYRKMYRYRGTSFYGYQQVDPRRKEQQYSLFIAIYQNLGLKGQKLSKFVPIRCQIDPTIPNYQLY